MASYIPVKTLTQAIKRNDIKEVERLINNKRIDPADRHQYPIRLASGNGYVEIVKLLLQDNRVNPAAEDDYAIKCASENGCVEVVKLLLQDKRVNPSAEDDYAIKHASENGHVEVVKLLLQNKRVNPSAEDDYAIQFASGNGHAEVVKLLLEDKRVDPSALDDEAIKCASENGCVEVVKLLLQDKRVNPSAEDDYAIKHASENGHVEVVKLLLQDERVKSNMSATKSNTEIASNTTSLTVEGVSVGTISHYQNSNTLMSDMLALVELHTNQTVFILRVEEETHLFKADNVDSAITCVMASYFISSKLRWLQNKYAIVFHFEEDMWINTEKLFYMYKRSGTIPSLYENEGTKVDLGNGVHLMFSNKETANEFGTKFMKTLLEMCTK